MIPNMLSRVPARQVADVAREQSRRQQASASSSRKINHSTVTRPEGIRIVGDGSIEAVAEDGSAIRLTPGVVEERVTEDSPWTPIKGGNPVAPLTSPVVIGTGGPGSIVLSWQAVEDQGSAGVMYDIYDVTAGDLSLGGTPYGFGAYGAGPYGGSTGLDPLSLERIATTASTGWLVDNVNGSRQYRVWARSGDKYAPAPSDIVTVAPDNDAVRFVVTNDVYATNGIQVGASNAPHVRIDAAVGIAGYDGVQVAPTTQIDPATGRLSAIGARIKGLIEATSAVLQSFTLRGAGRLDSGSSLTVGSGIVAPTQAPKVDRVWPSVATTHTGDFSATLRGMVLSADSSTWYSATAFFGGTVARMNLDGSYAGAPVHVFDSSFLPQGGITRIGSTFYVLGVGIGGGARDGKWFVKRLNSSFAEIGEWEVAFSSAPVRRPAIGTNGTDILIGRTIPVSGSQNMVVNRWNPTSGAYIGDAVVQPFVSATDVTSVNVVSSRILVGVQRAVFAYKISDGTRDTAAEFALAGAATMLGLGNDGTRLRHLDADGLMWTYSTLTTDTARSVDYSWYDSDPAGAGVHETDRGPAFAFTQAARSWFRVTTGDPYDTGEADAPDSVRIWVGGYRQPDLGPAVNTAVYEIPSTTTTSKAASFATAGLSAGSMQSETQTSTRGWKLFGSGRIAVPPPDADDEAVPRSYLRSGQQARATVAASSTFTGNAYFVRTGSLVNVYGTIARSSGTGTGLVTCIVVPAGFKPSVARATGGLVFRGTSTTYEFAIAAGATALQVAVSAVNAADMQLQLSYETTDGWP